MNEMRNRLSVVAFAVGMSFAATSSSLLAQESPKQHHLTIEAAETQLKGAIARVTSLNSKEIELHATSSMFRVLLVNTAYNNDPASDRDYLASTISALFAKTVENESSLQRFLVLHVEFVKRGRWRTKTVDTIEFRKGPDGKFGRHQT